MTISLPKRTIAVGLAFAVTLFLTGVVAVIPTAFADDTTAHTIEQLQDQINSLQAQLAALSGGGGGGACFAFTRDLFNGVGSGADVTALQDYLTSTGHFTFSGGSTGFFGPITQAATGAWQADNGVAPTAGYWGPISRAAYNNVCTPGDGDGDGDGEPSDSGGPLEGEEGSFKNFQLLGDPSSETVFESDDQAVIGWSYEAQDSDLRTERVRIRFDGTVTGTDKPWKIAKEVCLWHNDSEVACEDADSSSDWSEAVTNIYEKTFAGLKEITRQGDESNFKVAVKTLSTIDSSEDGTVWTVSLETNAVRAEDAAGEDLTGHSARLVETFTIDTDPDGKLELTLDSDKNQDTVVEVDATNNTADVVLMTWSQEVKEGSVMITDLGVDFVKGTGTGDLGDQLASIDLYREGTKVKTKSIASTATDSTVTFDNIDQNQEVGTEEWMIKGKVKNIDSTSFKEADRIALNIDNADFTAEAGNGDSVTPTGGTIQGGTVIFYTDGIKVAFVSATAVKSVDGSVNTLDDVGEFVIKYDVTAFGSDIWVQDGASGTATVAAADGASYTVTNGTVTTTTAATLDHDGTDGTNNFKVGKGNTQRFTLTVSVTANTGTSDFVKVKLNGIGWASADQATGTSSYTFDLSKFETGSINLIPRT